MFRAIAPSPNEAAISLPGDDIIKRPVVIMNRAFSLPATPEVVWPWFVQLGKNRAGWYFPRSVERCIPKKKRGLWRIDPNLLQRQVGERIDDWGGTHGYLELVSIEAPRSIVYRSTRGKLSMSWVITLWPEDHGCTRVIIRLKMAGIRHLWLLSSLGEAFDAATIAGLAAGLRQRLQKN